MKIARKLIPAVALALVGTAASARIAGYGTYPFNFSFSTPTSYVPIRNTGAPANTTLTVNVATAGRYVVTFSAECSVDAAAGDTSSWIDIDLEVNGVAVAPTVGNSDAFCGANGTAGFDGWIRPSISTTVNLLAGANTIRVLGRLDFAATGGWLSDSSLVVTQ